jgi:hypothetical protein
VPSELTEDGDGQLVTPESESAQANVTVTAVLFQPAAFGGGLCDAVTCGGVLSILRVTLVLAEFPAPSVAVPLMDWPTPSVVTVTGGGQTTLADAPPPHVNVTVTWVLFQPAAFGVGSADAAIVSTGVDVAVGVGVLVTVGVGVDVAVGVGVNVAVGVGVLVSVGVGVLVAVGDGVAVEVNVAVGVRVVVGVGVRVAVGVDVSVAVAVEVGVAWRWPTRLTYKNAPGSLASVTVRIPVRCRETWRSNPRTRGPKSRGVATQTPSMRIHAAERRWPPSGSPFCTCITKGSSTLAGTVTEVV